MSSLEEDWETLRPRPTGGKGRSLWLVGRCFGRLKVVERAGSTKRGESLWKCVCDCGAEKVVRRGHLKSGRVKSCGCLMREYQKVPDKAGLNHGSGPQTEIPSGVNRWRATRDFECREGPIPAGSIVETGHEPFYATVFRDQSTNIRLGLNPLRNAVRNGWLIDD